MTRLAPALLAFALISPAGAQELKTLHQKTLYAVGLSLGEQAKSYSLKPNEREYVSMGLADSLNGTPKMKLSDLQSRIDLLKTERWHTDFENVDKKKNIKKPSGLIYTEIRKGSGAGPSRPTSTVLAHYHGLFEDGKVFDSSVKRNDPITATLNEVIPCWTEGIQMMKQGGKAHLVCPAEIAYGAKGRGGIPGGATLIFHVELLKVLGQ